MLRILAAGFQAIGSCALRFPRIARAVDALYENSRASTKTESEREFQQGFVSMSSAILTSLEVVSYIVILIILLVLANTIVMAARERTGEYAILKTIGFSPGHLAGLIGGAVVILSFDYPLITYVNQVIGAVSVGDLMGGLVKAFVFGILVAGVGCLRGLRTGTGARAVGDSTTRAVVSGIVLIALTDGVFSVVYYYLGI